MPTDGYLTFEDGQVRLGKELLPGILVQQSIRGAVRYDQAHADNLSGKNKVPLGWEDADVNLTLDLLCDEGSDCYQKLAVINKIFKGAGKKANPRVYDVTGRHLRARGVSRVVFDQLDSWESDEDDTIQVTLTFREHLPAVVKREKQANAAKPAAGKGAAPAAKATPAAAPAIVEDTTNPFMAGFNAGNN